MIFRSAQLPFVVAQTQGTIPHQGCHLQPLDCQGALNTAKQQKQIPSYPEFSKTHDQNQTLTGRIFMMTQLPKFLLNRG